MSSISFVSFANLMNVRNHKGKSVSLMVAATIMLGQLTASANTADGAAGDNQKSARSHAGGFIAQTIAQYVDLQQGIPLTSTTIANIAEQVAPAVVNIEVNQPVSNMSGFNFPFGNIPDGFDFFFNGSSADNGRVTASDEDRAFGMLQEIGFNGDCSELIGCVLSSLSHKFISFVRYVLSWAAITQNGFHGCPNVTILRHHHEPHISGVRAEAPVRCHHSLC